MADSLLIVCNPLCFLLSKYGRTPLRVLKNATTDFYSAVDLATAKQQLLSDIERINPPVKPARVPVRRDGADRIVHEADDLLSLLTFLDEQKLFSCIARYVSDSPDNMPSTRLYEGDLKIIMDYLSRMNDRMEAFESTLTSVVHNMQSLQVHTAPRLPDALTCQSTPVRAHSQSVNHSVVFSQAQPSGPVGTTASQGNSIASSAKPALKSTSDSGVSQDINVATLSNHSHSWASRVENENRFAVLDVNVDSVEENNRTFRHSISEQPFVEVVSRSKRKRQRQDSTQQITQQNIQTSNGQPISVVTDIQSVRHSKRAPLVIGKSALHTNECKIVAARSLRKKTVFYVDNVDPSVSVTEMEIFVTSLAVDVASCFEVKPRRHRSNSDRDLIGCKAFRLCIFDDQCEKLLNADVWPANIAISQWYFKTQSNRTSVTAAAITDSSAVCNKTSDLTAHATEAATFHHIATSTSAATINNATAEINTETSEVSIGADEQLMDHTLSDTIIYNGATD